MRWATSPTPRSSSSASACSAAAAPPRRRSSSGQCGASSRRSPRPRPLLVVLEDVHWAEPTLLDLVEHVSRWSRDAPILLLCVARAELLEERPQWEGALVRLEPLSSDEATELLDALDDGGILSPELARARRRGGAGQSALRRAARRHAGRRGARRGGARRAAADDPGASRRAARPPRPVRATGARASRRRRQGVLARRGRRSRTAGGTRRSARRCSGSYGASWSSRPSRAFPGRTASASGTR